MFVPAQNTNINNNTQNVDYKKILTAHNYAQIHKIYLRSIDRVSGTIDNAVFNVKLPDGLHGRGVLVAEDFSQVGTSFANTPLEVHIRDIAQTRSYSSQTNGYCDVICTSRGGQWQNAGSSTSSLGIPIQDLTTFRNTQLTVYFSTVDGTTSSGLPNTTALTPALTNHWSMTMYLIAIDEV